LLAADVTIKILCNVIGIYPVSVGENKERIGLPVKFSLKIIMENAV
jgi:hypothetical protein